MEKTDVDGIEEKSAENYNPYDNVLKVVEQAAGILGYAKSDYEAIKYPERELKVSIPVKRVVEAKKSRGIWP